MKLEEVLREKEIKEIKDFIENTNEYKELSNDSLLIPKLLVIDGTDKYFNSLILDEISDELKMSKSNNRYNQYINELNLEQKLKLLDRSIWRK